MAIKIYEQFAPFANPADGDYPQGSFKNDSIPGAEDGTPLDAVWANDYAGFDAALLAEAGIAPSGQPDKLGASQRVDAMRLLFSGRFNTIQEMISFSGHKSGFKYSTPSTDWVVTTESIGVSLGGGLYAKPNTVPTSIDYGLIYGDALEASNNTTKLIVAASLYGNVTIVVNENLYLAPLPLNNTGLSFDNVFIGGLKSVELVFQTSGTLFTIKEGGTFYQNDISVKALAGMVEVATTERLANTRINALVCENSNLTGYLRYGIGLANSLTQDPAVKTNGAKFISHSKNIIKNCDYAGLFLINAMYDTLIFESNYLENCNGMYCDNSMQNTTVNYIEVKSFKKSASFVKNKMINSIDHFSDSAVVGSIYAGIALSEGNYAWYDGNYCKNLQVKESITGSCNDFYYADEKSEVGVNTVVNRFHWGVQAQSNHFVNCCIKIKKAVNWSCLGYNHWYDPDYFDYQIANNGVSLTDIKGDFLAVEHGVEDAPADIINVRNVNLHSKVLNSAPRNNYRVQNYSITGGEFFSNATGFSDMCAAIADHTNVSDTQKSYDVSDNKFQLPNATLSLMNLLITDSQAVNVRFSGNSGEVLNLTGANIGMTNPLTAIRKIEADGNNILVTGTSFGLFNKNNIMPVMTSFSLNDNIIDAANATSIDSLFGGVTSTSVNCSASARIKVGLSSAIPLDTIVGKDASQPMLAQDGQRLIKGILYDTDFANFAIEYPFEISYILNSSSQAYTTLKILNSSGVFTTIRSDQVSTTPVKVVTTHPNMTAQVTSGVVGLKTMQLTLTLGAGLSKRTIDIKMIKV